MHQIGFIYQDPDHRNRHGDGVELVKIPAPTARIGFFCAEYDVLWTSSDEIGTAAGTPVSQSMACGPPISRASAPRDTAT